MTTRAAATGMLGAVLSLIATIACSAREPKQVDWQALESALATYLDAPSDERAAKIAALLPISMTVDRTQPAFDVAAHDRIYHRLSALEPIASHGERHGLRVAYALYKISDADFTEWLSEMIGASIDSDPEAFLTELEANKMRSPRPCIDAAMLGEDTVDDFAAQRAKLQARLRAVEAVSLTSLSEERECAAEALRGRIAALPE